MTADYSSPEFRARFTEQARRAAAHSDCIIAVSEFTALQVRDLLGFDKARIRVVPHGVHLPQSAEESPREKVVLFVGALQVRKNVVRLVEAFETLPNDWQLVLAGSPGGYGAKKILQRIQASRAFSRIRVTGYIPTRELVQLYRRASIFAFPSLDEGFGMPVLEAMAHSVPVLTSNRSALAEVAAKAALTVDPEQTEEIAAGLRELASDESARAGLAALGRARARQFPWSRPVEETYSIYRQMLGYPAHK